MSMTSKRMRRARKLAVDGEEEDYETEMGSCSGSRLAAGLTAFEEVVAEGGRKGKMGRLIARLRVRRTALGRSGCVEAAVGGSARQRSGRSLAAVDGRL